MLKVKDIKLAPEAYGSAYECVITFQVGDHAYNTVKAKLTPEATREVVELAVGKATAMLVVTASEIAIAGEPIPLIDAPTEELDPEFAEVEPAPFAPPEPTAPKPLTEEPI